MAQASLSRARFATAAVLAVAARRPGPRGPRATQHAASGNSPVVGVEIAAPTLVQHCVRRHRHQPGCHAFLRADDFWVSSYFWPAMAMVEAAVGLTLVCSSLAALLSSAEQSMSSVTFLLALLLMPVRL